MNGEQKRGVREEFDRWALAGRADEMARGHRDVTEQALDRVRFSSRDRALDVGCGNGWAVELMKERGAVSVFGVDLSPEMLRRAKPDLVPRICAASATRLPFQGGAFTRVLSVEALYYCPDLDGALREIRRVCANGARFLCIVDLYAENPGSRGWVQALAVDVHLLPESEYVHRLRAAGFRQVQTIRLRDRRPGFRGEDFRPTVWFPTYEDYTAYREAGGLLIEAEA